MKEWLKPAAVFAAVLAFLILTAPANHSEAEDAYFYARMAEQGAWSEMFHGHHLLYLPLMRMIFRAAQFAGYAGRSLPVLISVSMVSGAFAVCVFSALLRRICVNRRTVWPFSAALLFSYGFWRYSTTAEIYVPVTALSLLTLYCAVRAGERPFFFICGILSGTAALLLHLASLPAVLLTVPLLLAFRQSRRRAAVYLLATGLFAAAAYRAVAYSAGLTVFTDTQIVHDSLASPCVWLRGVAAFGQNLLSANFLFAIPAATEKLGIWFPFQMLQEEIFAGRLAPERIRWLAPVTLGVSAAFLITLMISAVRNIRRAAAEYPVPAGTVLLWLGGTAAMAFLFEPANPEIWLSALPPFWLLSGLLWNAAPDRLRLRRISVLLTASLLAHNWISGMSLVRSSAGDYCRQKSAWITEQAGAGDLVLTADSHSFVTYLEYQTPARIVDAKFINSVRWNTLKAQTSGRIFVFSDVIELLPPVTRRTPEAVREIREMSAQLRAGLRPVHSDQFGAVYQWNIP